jgi:hypothetical protein
MFLLATTAGALLGGAGALLNGAIAVGGAATGNDANLSSLQESFPQVSGNLSPTGRSQSQDSQGATQATQGGQTDQQQVTVSANSNSSSETATRGVAQGALWGCIALLLGLLMAAWGGWTGTASLPMVDIVTTGTKATTRT